MAWIPAFEESEEERQDFGIKGSALQKELQEIRGLSFKKNVTLSSVPRGQLETVLGRLIDRDYPPAKLNALNKSLVEFGFIDKNVNIRQVFIDFYAGEAAGFYDIETSTLFIISDRAAGSVNEEDSAVKEANRVLIENFGISLEDFAIFHELEHALIDQNFPMKSFMDRPSMSMDRKLATLAVLEGDAYLTSLIFLYRPMGMESEVIMKDLAVPEVISRRYIPATQDENVLSPQYFVSTLLFPVIQGVDFMRAIYREKGWDGMNSVLSSPPVSTEQILHPKKYRSAQDDPKETSLRSILSKVGNKWSEIARDTLGEFRIYLLIDRILGKEDTALLASEGWGGDTYQLFESERGEKILSLATVWDSEKDAHEFWDAYSRSLQADSYVLSKEIRENGAIARYLTRNDAQIFLKIEGRSVESIKAPPTALMQILGESENPKKE